MKNFVCTEPNGIKFVRDDTGEFVQMAKDNVLSLPDEQVVRFCANGWGTCKGVKTKPRKPGVTKINPVNTKSE